MDDFKNHWSALIDDVYIDLFEKKAFDNLLEEVNELANAVNEYDHEGGTDMCSTYTIF